MKSDEQVKELFERIGRANAVNATIALLPHLDKMKNQVFQEFALPGNDALSFARLSGKAAVIDELLRGLMADAEDGKLALEELKQKGD